MGCPDFLPEAVRPDQDGQRWSQDHPTADVREERHAVSKLCTQPGRVTARRRPGNAGRTGSRIVFHLARCAAGQRAGITAVAANEG